MLNNGKSLFDLYKTKQPDFIEMSAVMMILHSFYNGIENILVLISKHYDDLLSNNNKWHQELLEKACVQ